MKRALLLALWIGKIFAFSAPPAEVSRIAERIWQNECGGKIENLTHWNQNENFASMGIGHFIWYCKDRKERFQETFPDLLVFLQKEGVVLPDWLKITEGCPWNSREAFYQNIHSP